MATLSDYRVIYIKKKGGGRRKVVAPSPELLEKQKRALRWLKMMKIGPGKYAHGFVKGRSIKTNAEPHIGKKIILRLDIRDFFSSVTDNMVLDRLRRTNIGGEKERVILELCMLEGVLPQGAPTSPFLANMVMTRFDARIASYMNKLCAPDGCNYTRYADDLCFSSDNEILGFKSTVGKIRGVLRNEGFYLNDKKIKLNRHGRRQTVTGTVVNEKVNVPRVVRRRTRAGIHNLKKSLTEGTFNHRELSRLDGMVAHIRALSEHHGNKLKLQLTEVKLMKESMGL